MQCEIAAAYMSGNLRHTKQLISELTVPTTGHPLRPDALAVEARVCDRTVVPQRGKLIKKRIKNGSLDIEKKRTLTNTKSHVK